MTATMMALDANAGLGATVSVRRPAAAAARRGGRPPHPDRPECDWTARMRGVIGGDEAGYRSLLGDIGALAREVARRLVARFNFGDAIVDDIVQETLLAVHLTRGNWDSARPLKPWIATIARNKTIDALRRSQARASEPISDDLASPAAMEPGSLMDADRLIARLRPRQREIVKSIALREESIADVASRLSMSKGAVRVEFHRAVRAMGTMIGPNADPQCAGRVH